MAVERIKEYSEDIDNEKDWEIGELKPDAKWPEHGAVQFDDYGKKITFSRNRSPVDPILETLN